VRLADPLDGASLASSEARLLSMARAQTGLEDPGPDDHCEGLSVLLGALDAEADLSEVGRLQAVGSVVTGLAGRLQSQAGFDACPEAADAPIERPLLIVGMPRTASTALHRMLSRDPALQGLELWLAESPMPRPPRDAWPRIPAFARCDAATRAVYAAQPEIRAIHEMDADEVDECWHLMHQSFESVTYECNYHVPSYARWWAARDMRVAYRRYRRNLQLIGHREPARRWLLKDATHMFHLEDFLEVFPDALVVTTERDPVELVPSVCSLTSAFGSRLSRSFDARAHGAAQLALWARGLAGIEAVGRELAADRFYRMSFSDFQVDPIREVRRIYERFGMDLSAVAEGAMTDWREQNRAGRHGAHRYRAEDYGLTPERIADAFARSARAG
jgi:hypothetical protein